MKAQEAKLSQTNDVFLPVGPATCPVTPAHPTMIPPGPGPGPGPASFSQEPAQALVFSGVGPGGTPDPLLIFAAIQYQPPICTLCCHLSLLPLVSAGGRENKYSPQHF